MQSGDDDSRGLADEFPPKDEILKIHFIILAAWSDSNPMAPKACAPQSETE